MLESALQQGIIPAIIVAIYLVIIKIIDSHKEKSQIKISSDVIKSINSIGDFIETLTKNIIDKDKDKCRAAIEDTMYSSAMRLMNFVSVTIVNNHIEVNKENILTNIHNIINAEYYSVYSTLSMYIINNKSVSSLMKPQWIEEVEKDMIDIIYNELLSKEYKIFSFGNKINLKFQSYITYIINHIV